MLNINNLHDYQKACVKHVIKHPYCGLFLEMGLGKTISTLTAIELLMYDFLEINSVLVIAPKRVVETVWAEEAKKWEHTKHLTFSKIIGSEKRRIEALKMKADIYIISRDNVAWLCSLYAAKLPFDMLVIDELSSFKSFSTNRFKSLRLARPHFKRVVGLTGTPTPNSLIELWPQMYLLDRGQRLGKTITSYRSTYFRPGVTNGYVVYSYAPLQESPRLITEKISDICISMKAKDYIELPDVMYNYVPVKLGKAVKDEYDKFEKENLLKLIEKNPENGENEVNITAVNAGVLANKLLQFASGAIYDENKETHYIHDTKLEALREIVDASNGKSILVAYNFIFDKSRIMNYFIELKPRELKSADDINDWNEGKIRILLAHPQSVGHGINLQAGGNIIVWFGLSWSLESYQQFNARLYRQGQKENVIIHHLIASDTYDEEVVRAIKNKQRTQDALIDSIKARLEKYTASMR